MRYIDIDNINFIPGRRLERSDTFSFHCHKDIACFNKCCRNLNLFLYPYDIVRLKKCLNITSDEFIDKFVDVVSREQHFFPVVLLKMSDKKEAECNFLSESGCSVYLDRPYVCRMFPIVQGTFYDAQAGIDKSLYFFNPPPFCLGKSEIKEWTPDLWIKDQDADFYTKMAGEFEELQRLFQSDPWGAEGIGGQKAKMAFMASYNIDKFRDFLFNSSFLKRYKIKSDVLKKIKTDDVSLLKLGFEWIKYYLWSIKSLNIKMRS
ncbi:MAG: YkgJ family cysteine cluster protein [Desulfobacterales bacterium]|nr:YkgJ family cysteine cluster protein [Desulfobacterales bacterium]MBF0395620.1 YkgJ family cysteine cluster protein [Desulfobacterales bacterium]